MGRDSSKGPNGINPPPHHASDADGRRTTAGTTYLPYPACGRTRNPCRAEAGRRCRRRCPCRDRRPTHVGAGARVVVGHGGVLPVDVGRAGEAARTSALFTQIAGQRFCEVGWDRVHRARGPGDGARVARGRDRHAARDVIGRRLSGPRSAKSHWLCPPRTGQTSVLPDPESGTREPEVGSPALTRAQDGSHTWSADEPTAHRRQAASTSRRSPSRHRVHNGACPHDAVVACWTLTRSPDDLRRCRRRPSPRRRRRPSPRPP